MKNKRGMEMGFNWLFAIIAGGFILFLAIFISGKFITTQEKSMNTQTAAQFKSLFDPLETGLASGKSTRIGFKKESKIYFNCDYRDNKPFGKQTISFSEKTFGNEYGQQGEDVTLTDKYIFSEEILEGREVYLFSKPFFMSFKIADITLLISEDYCFYDSPEKIQEDLEGLNINKITFMNSSEECEGISVCFNEDKCDINVKVSENIVERNNEELYYEGNLVYGAIFSSEDIYECNIKRLMNKLAELGDIYENKIKIMERADCYSNLALKIDQLTMSSQKLRSSKDLEIINKIAEDIEDINSGAKTGCRLY